MSGYVLFDRLFVTFLGGDFVMILMSYHMKGPMNKDINTLQWKPLFYPEGNICFVILFSYFIVDEIFFGISFLKFYKTSYVFRYCESLNVKKGGSINFDENSLTTKQCTGYVPHKPSWYDVEHLIPNVDERIAPSTYKVHG